MTMVIEWKAAEERFVKKEDGLIPPGWLEEGVPENVDESDRASDYNRLATIQDSWVLQGYKVLWRVSDGVATMWTQL